MYVHPEPWGRRFPLWLAHIFQMGWFNQQLGKVTRLVLWALMFYIQKFLLAWDATIKNSFFIFRKISRFFRSWPTLGGFYSWPFQGLGDLHLGPIKRSLGRSWLLDKCFFFAKQTVAGFENPVIRVEVVEYVWIAAFIFIRELNCQTGWGDPDWRSCYLSQGYGFGRTHLEDHPI